MRTINRNVKPLIFKGEDGETLTVQYTNRGEPYREGVEVQWIIGEQWGTQASVFLETEEMRRLRDILNEMLPPSKAARYRMLRDGESIEESDEFLEDDPVDWTVVGVTSSTERFISRPYNSTVHKPFRRPIP